MNARSVAVTVGLLLAPALVFAQQPDPLTVVKVEGYVYEPQAVPPTDERLAQLQLPSGFALHRFAEGLYNPRMLDVAPDGTVHATQRTPGNLVDAKSPLPFVHWTAVFPANVTNLPQAVPRIERHPAVPNASQGSNSRSTIGYFGPRPPAGSPPHSYHFQVFALDTVPNLPSGYNRHALLKAMQGHVLARGDLVGKFARAP